ncbi:MAG: hypothetical protein JST88_00625 [Bacteroidetes bacterium]|nr:hypothetical protein [Bacteroidota bacterium]
MLFVVYCGFLITISHFNLRLIVYCIVGLLCIFSLNVIRCSILALLSVYQRQWLNFSHHYLFYTIIYIYIFLLWHLYANPKHYFKEK